MKFRGSIIHKTIVFTNNHSRIKYHHAQNPKNITVEGTFPHPFMENTENLGTSSSDIDGEIPTNKQEKALGKSGMVPMRWKSNSQQCIQNF